MTPDFIAQDNTVLTKVRFYTPFDPYYYSVDNRPLQDLSANVIVATQGGDSARRAALISQLAASSWAKDAFATTNPAGAVTGLEVSSPGQGILQIAPGSIFIKERVSTNVATEIIKHGFNLQNTNFLIPAPVNPGTSVVYLIQVKFQSLTSDAMETSSLPFLDKNNPFLPSLLLNGELKISMKTGNTSATGFQSAPGADVGWTPLYAITSTYGIQTPTIVAALGSPDMKGLNQAVAMSLPATSPGIMTEIAEVVTPTLIDGAESRITLDVKAGGLNPYKPVKFKVLYSSDRPTENVAVKLRYYVAQQGTNTGHGDNVGFHVNETLLETFTTPAQANTLSEVTLTGSLPVSEFAGFDSTDGRWKNKARKLFLNLTRMGSDAADTTNGSVFVHEVIAFQ